MTDDDILTLDIVFVGSRSVIFIDVKKRFYVFYCGHFLTFFIFQTFFILKNVGKVKSGKRIIKKHFQNNSNEIDL